MGAIAERHPRLRLCIDSLGAAPRTTDKAAFADLPELLALAKRPNVVVKAEGVPAMSSEPFPYRNLHPYLRQVYDAFGPQRLFWGSDFTRLKSPYKEMRDIVHRGAALVVGLRQGDDHGPRAHRVDRVAVPD